MNSLENKDENDEEKSQYELLDIPENQHSADKTKQENKRIEELEKENEMMKLALDKLEKALEDCRKTRHIFHQKIQKAIAEKNLYQCENERLKLESENQKSTTYMHKDQRAQLIDKLNKFDKQHQEFKQEMFKFLLGNQENEPSTSKNFNSINDNISQDFVEYVQCKVEPLEYINLFSEPENVDTDNPLSNEYEETIEMEYSNEYVTISPCLQENKSNTKNQSFMQHESTSSSENVCGRKAKMDRRSGFCYTPPCTGQFKTQLKRHVERVHEKKLNHECYCGKKFFSLNDYTVHLKFHERTKMKSLQSKKKYSILN